MKAYSAGLDQSGAVNTPCLCGTNQYYEGVAKEIRTSSPSLHTGSRSCTIKRSFGNRSASLNVVDPIPPPTSTTSALSASSGNGKAIAIC